MTTLPRDRFGVPVQASSEEAVACLDEAVLALVRLSGDPVALAKRAGELDPRLSLSRAVLAYLHLYVASQREADLARLVLDEAEAGGLRERAHLGAARAWAAGQLDVAAGLLEQALLEDPRDLLALRVVHDLYFQLGDRVNLRDSAARVLPAWPEETAGSGYVRAMQAFGLEECGEYAAALARARSALGADAGDVWAQHAVLHVHEMEGHPDLGLTEVAETSPIWEASFFAPHNWWHAALYHLELGAEEHAVELYDGPLRHSETGGPLAALDAASLLWRLSLLGVPLGERAAELLELFEPTIGDSTQSFGDWHAAMAFGLAGRPGLTDALIGELEHRRFEPGDEVVSTTGLALLRGFAAFSAGRPAETIELLTAARPRAFLVGGSHAQRDVLDLTLLAAASAAGEGRLVRALVAERCARKPSSARLARRVVDANRRAGANGRARGASRPDHQGGDGEAAPAAPEDTDAFGGVDELALLQQDAIEASVGWYSPSVQRTRVETPDGVVSALQWGEGAPEIVLLHGAALNAHTWNAVALVLDRPLLALDLPGHGESSWREDGRYDPEVIAPAVARAIEELAIAPVTLVGQSLGGMTAIEVARLNPRLVARLVLVDISPGMRPGRAASVRSFLAGPQVFSSRAEIVGRAAAFGYGRSLAALERGVWHNTNRRPDGSVVWKHHFGQLPQEAPRQSVLAELWAPLEAYDGEVLLIWAEQGFLGEEEASELTQRLRRAEAVRVPGGHNVQESEPIRLAAVLRRFLGRNDG